MKRTGVFQLGWSDVRKGHFCWELNKGREKTVSLYWRRALEKCKGPEATACWFCLRKNKEIRWAQVVGREIKKRPWGWSGNEGEGWRACHMSGNWEECDFTLNKMGRHGEIWGAVTWSDFWYEGSSNCYVENWQKGPRAESGRSGGDRCQVQMRDRVAVVKVWEFRFGAYKGLWEVLQSKMFVLFPSNTLSNVGCYSAEHRLEILT